MSSRDEMRAKIVEILSQTDDQKVIEIAKESLARHDVMCDNAQKSTKALQKLEDAEADRSLAIKYALFDAECVIREVCDRQ